MNKVSNIINALQENVDGDNVVAFGFVADVNADPKHNISCFAVGNEKTLAEMVASTLEDETIRKIFTKALALRVSNKINNLQAKINENGHKNYN